MVAAYEHALQQAAAIAPTASKVETGPHSKPKATANDLPDLPLHLLLYIRPVSPFLS